MAPWQLALNLGCESGVHVQTCGHHIHLECLMPYLNSLQSQQRQQSLAVERGEYACPLCRQLANSVLPLSTELGDCSTLVRSRSTCMSLMAMEISNLLSENPHAGKPSTLPMQEAMSRAMEAMAKITDGLFRFYHNFGSPPTPECLVIFVSSIVRTNLEVDILQRGGNLCTQSEDIAAATMSATMPKRSCLVPLLHVLGMHAKTLATWPEWQMWQQLAGIVSKLPEQAVAKPKTKEVPLLFKDPSALLTQLILLLPMRLEQTHFTCVIKSLYNLLYFESLLQIICTLSEKWRAHFQRLSPDVTTLEGCLSLLAVSLGQGQLFMEDSELGASAREFEKTETESELQAHCLPFLRIAALLRHYLYGEELPEVASEQREFVRLVYFLELVTDGMEWSKFNAAVALSWAHVDGSPTMPTPVETLPPASVVTRWCEELLVLTSESQVATRSLVKQHQRWHQPRLLRLPDSYDKIFQYYHRRQCVKCHSVPRETSVCLLCGTIVCLKENCCKQQEVCEAVQHSIKCGAGTAMFLVVTSSYIIVIRGRRACLWGSVYLDSFGEEDRDLKRGKPLYLSAGRYQLLEQQWISHRFDHTNKKWVWHRDAL